MTHPFRRMLSMCPDSQPWLPTGCCGLPQVSALEWFVALPDNQAALSTAVPLLTQAQRYVVHMADKKSRDENTSSYNIRAHTSSYELIRVGAGQDMRCVIIRDVW
jgi:hypothetical protein